MKFPDDPPQTDFGQALRTARLAKKLSQEHFVEVTSQTHMSRLERGKKLPTLGMVEQLANAMDLHPLTLFVLTYLTEPTNAEVRKLLEHVKEQIENLDLNSI